MQAFKDINIFPSYHNRTAIVAWVVDPSIRDAEFYVYRRIDGGAEWEALSTEPTYGSTFADTEFYIPNKVQQPMYKVLAIKGDKEWVSPDVALFSKVGRKAFGLAHNIIRAKYFQARQDGIPVLYYPLAKNGEKTSTLDSVTGQRTKADCATGDGETDENDYNTYYAAGYYRPFITYIRFLGERVQKENILDTGIYDSTVLNAELLAFPPVRTGDMIVDVSTDRRWTVGANIQTDLVKGVIPVSYTAQISLQPHNSPCYAVPIPSNYNAMVRRLTWPSIP